MSNVEKPEDWTDEEFDTYFGSADDPIDDEPDYENSEILDLWAGYWEAGSGEDDGGTVA